ncbi:MAG: bifunctional tRNA (5-methylaminomethyl-2-thiouridine)(34)-methyltransferase MnmD/FAD-dependent 5-carboxymethylaminomethyl-2-thiouridine(34) oxidoreductase MnmC [Pseudohongiellaceae bacterium]
MPKPPAIPSETDPKDSFVVTNAALDWTDEAHPRSLKFDDIYHSNEGACDESEHVFVKGAQLLERWQDQKDRQSSYTIGEIGFGSGLNFLMTWKNWNLSKNKPCQLHYLGFEKYPLKIGDMARLLAMFPSLEPLSSRLLAHYCDHSKVCHRIRLADDVLLDLHFGDAATELQSLDCRSRDGVDSWFLDGFSPKQNPLLWQENLVALVAQHSHAQTTLATYSAAGFLRRQLISVGFKVEKAAGFGLKRHMTQAVFEPDTSHNMLRPNEPLNTQKSWFVQPKSDNSASSAIVIGAGISGCCAAYSLAKRGIDVVVLESGDSVASGATGIPQLALRPRLFKHSSALAHFFLQGYLYSTEFFSALNHPAQPSWHPTGVVQMAKALNKKSVIDSDFYQSLYSEQVLTALSVEQVQELTGLKTEQEALHFAKGGWIDSKTLCKFLLEHKRIKLVSNYSANALTASQGKPSEDQKRWQVSSSNSAQSDLFTDLIVIANGHNAAQFSQTNTLPLQAVRGQATQITLGHEQNLKINQVLSGQRSLFPSLESLNTLSATYHQGISTDACADDDHSNLISLTEEFPQLTDLKAVNSWVGVRCNTEDFSPVIGMAPDWDAMNCEYATLKRNAAKEFKNVGHYHQGLYLSVAHGSNGLATAPLAGEILASMICGEPSPISQSALAALSATRFIIRNLKKQKP